MFLRWNETRSGRALAGHVEVDNLSLVVLHSAHRSKLEAVLYVYLRVDAETEPAPY